MTHRTRATLAFFLLSLLSGCSVTGAPFASPDPTPANKSLIYFYRPWVLQGAAAGLKIMDNGAPAVSLQVGQFIPYIVEPGLHTLVISTVGDVIPLTLTAMPDETYYIRSGIRSGVMLNTLYLNRVYPEEALPELKQCCKTGNK